MKIHPFFCTLIAASAWMSASAPSAAQTSFPVEVPTLQVGDSWSYKVTDEWKKEVAPNLLVRTVTGIDNFIRYTGTSVAGAEFKFATNKALNTPYMVDKEAQLNKNFVWPLTETTTWENKRKEKRRTVTIVFESECKVKGWEKVTVPAGTFDAVKFTCKGNYTNDNVGAEAVMGGSGFFVEENWYAPSVKQNIKSTVEYRHGGRLSSQTLVELASFKVQ